jgi:hypothetical protein
MKKIKLIVAIISLTITVGCVGYKQSMDEFIAVDVTQTNYPKKELILQDFMNVEYIALETNDDFLNQGFVQDVGNEIILVKNLNDDGNIFVYDRTGKALRKINRKGRGNEEYTNIFNIVLDENNGEMFVNTLGKTIVYDLYGKFKRSFILNENGGSLFYTDTFNYDDNNLICYDQYNEEVPFVLVSKHDGRITKEIKIPFNKKIFLEQQLADGENTITITPGPYRAIIPFKGNWMLTEISSDTVYTFLPDYSLRTFLVRTPPIQFMDPGVFLMLRFFSDQYIFMETIKNEYDWLKRRGFPPAFMMYDKQENTFFGYNVYNGDYSIKKEIYMNRLRPVNHEIESWQPLEAYQLIESYEKGELKGRLKEIAATLDEYDNPVIMLIKHK